MNKKGFLSTSLVYSFFLVFLMLLLFIVSNLINNRILVTRINNQIKEDIYSDEFNYNLINLAKDKNSNLVYQNKEDSFNDYSYRFVGENPNNYVCFGSNTSPCPSNNLYRMIGIIDGNIKLIKYEPIKNFAIDLESGEYSSTRLINYLNSSMLDTTTYFDTIKDYIDLIKPTTWHIGGINDSIDFTDKVVVYNEEMVSTTILREVGLMYISDFLGASDADGNNWLKVENNTWFITKLIMNDDSLAKYYYLDSTSNILTAEVTNEYDIYPVFYLKSTIKLISGDGTKDTPYFIGGSNV